MIKLCITVIFEVTVVSLYRFLQSDVSVEVLRTLHL